MKKLEERIQNAINEKMMKLGKMGSEVVRVEFTLTEEEKEEFYEISDNYNYEMDGNILSIVYSEDMGIINKYKSIIDIELYGDTERALNAMELGELTETSLNGKIVLWYFNSETEEEWAYYEDGEKLTEEELKRLG